MNQKGRFQPKFARSSRHRTPVHQQDATRVEDRWGWIPTADGRGPVQEDARKAREILHILAGRDQVRRPDHCQTDGDLHGTTCVVESQADLGTNGSHPEVDGASSAESGNGHP